MREVQIHNIDGTDYRIQQLGAKVGKTVLMRLFRIAGPAMEAKDDEQVTRLLGALGDAEVDFLCETFAKTTAVCMTNAKGQACELELSNIFDEHFAGKYDLMLKWLWACIKANFETFPKGLGLDADKLRALMMKAMAEGKAPIAPSGESSPTASALSTK